MSPWAHDAHAENSGDEALVEGAFYQQGPEKLI